MSVRVIFKGTVSRDFLPLFFHDPNHHMLKYFRVEIFSCAKNSAVSLTLLSQSSSAVSMIWVNNNNIPRLKNHVEKKLAILGKQIFNHEVILVSLAKDK